MVNDLLNSWFSSVLNYSTLTSGVLNALQILIDLVSVYVTILVLWWFIKLPFKIINMFKRGQF